MTVKGANQDGERARAVVVALTNSLRAGGCDDARDYRTRRVVKLSGGGVKCG